MLPKELFKKIRQIEITTSRLVTDVFAGQYHSVFKGQGIEFDEVREYQLGDDIRSIDWNVTARTGKPHIKKYVEERELTVMILVDASSSCRFGTVNQLKSTIAAEIAAILASSAIRNNDKVGIIIFSDKIEKFIPPRKGLKHVLRVIREVLYFKPERQGTDLIFALEYLNKVTSRKTVSFIVSDFIYPPAPKAADPAAGLYGEKLGQLRGLSLKQVMSITNKKHDLVAITLNDPKDRAMPKLGLINFRDPETGMSTLVDTSSRKFQEIFKDNVSKQLTAREELFKWARVDHIDISTDIPYENALVKFFRQRKKRLSHV
ncbi:MAG: DUF58 domain-containing protein [Candidatus Omnitrophica bacterium]|nr:DUF58 domain-containing protein [Candidatus Omnitrophota bacterium]